MPQSFEAKIGFSADKASLDRTAKDVKRALGGITGNASEFQKSLDASTARVFAFGAATTVISGVNQAFTALVGTTIEVEKRMIEIQSIFGGTESSFNKFRESIFQVAKDTGQSFTTVADAAAEFARQGLSAAETAKRLNAALVLTQVSGLDSVKSVKTLTAAINGYQSAGLTAEQVTNKLVAVDTKFAVSAKDLADGLSRAGSTAEDAGVGFDELLGIITAVEQRTSRGGAVIGNALKTIFTRISRPKIIEDLQALGVAIDNSQNGVQKLQAIGAAFEAATGDTSKQSAIKELAAGGFQINVISAALKDLTSSQSAYSEAAKTSAGATNEAFQKSEEFRKSLAAQLNSLVAGFTNLAEKIGSITLTPILGTLVKIADKFGTFLNEAFDPETGSKLVQGIFKSIGAFLSGPGLVLISTAFFKIIQLVSRFAKEGFKTVLEIGTQTEKLRILESAISAELHEGSDLRKVMLSTTSTQVEKQAAINKALKDSNDLHLREQNIVRETAKILSSMGVRGKDVAGMYVGKGNKPIPAKAGGFTPSFAETVAETSAAREHGYKAGKVFNTRLYDGTGGSFKATVNSAEKIKTVRGPNGKLGTYVTPPNGMAAKGFIPNYSGFNDLRFSDAMKNLGRLSPKQLQDKLKGARTTPEEKAAGEQILAKKLSEQKRKEDNRTRISGASYAMLVPSRGTIRTESPFEGSINNKSFSVDNFNVRGPDFSKVDSIASPQDEKLKKNITSQILAESANFANSLGGSRVDAGGVLNQLSKSQGALGGINSAVGAAFDLAVASAFPISKYQEAETNARNKIGGNFDIRNASSDLKNLFNLPSSVSKADFKATDSKGNRSSMVGKMMKEQGVSSAQKAQVTNFLKDQEKRGKFKAGGFIPNFAPFKKDSLSSGRKKYSTQFGSYANVFPDASRKQIKIDYISSKKKGDAYKLFKHLAKIAKRSKSSIYSNELIPQIKDEFDPFSKAQRGATNWEKLISIFPQLKYRQLPKSVTSGLVNSEKQRFEGFAFRNLGELENLVNRMPKDDFDNDFRDANIFDLKTKMLGGGFAPNFASPNALKSLQLRAAYKGGDPRLLAEAANARTLLKKQQGKNGINLRGVFDKLDGEAGISQIIDSAFTAAGPTASNEDVFKIFEAQNKQNPQKLRDLVKNKGFVPNFADLNKLMKGRNADQTNWIKQASKKLNLPLNGETYSQLAKLYEENVSVNRVDKSGRASTQGMLNLFGGGFVPNFSAVQDAISREKKAGVPSSAIYIDQSPKLKSTRNPSGLMVANRIDEPRGGYQGIARAKKEGKNPKSYGAGKGFIPNYAAPQIADFSSHRDTEKVKRFQDSLEFLFQAFDDGNIKLKQITKSAKDIGVALGITGDKAREFRESVQAAAFEASKPVPKRFNVPTSSGGNPLPYIGSPQAKTARGGWKAWNEPAVPSAELKENIKTKKKKILPIEEFKSALSVNSSNKAKKQEYQTYLQEKNQRSKEKKEQSFFGRASEKGKNLGNPIALSIGLSVLSGFTQSAEEADSSLKSVSKELLSTASSAAAAGSAFGPFGTAIGAAAGLAFSFFSSLNKEAELSSKLREQETRSMREGAAFTELKKTEQDVFGSAGAKSANISSVSDLKKADKKNNIGFDFDSLARLKQDVIEARATDFETSSSKGADSEERKQSLKIFENAEKKYIERLQAAVDAISSSKSTANLYEYVDKLGGSFLKTSRLIDEANGKLDQKISNLNIAEGVELNDENPRSKFLKKRVEIQSKKSLAERSLGGFKKEFFGKGFFDALKEGLGNTKTLDLSRTAKPLPTGYQLPSFTQDKSLARLNPLAPANILGNTKRNFLEESRKPFVGKSQPSTLKTKESFEDLAGLRNKTNNELLKQASIDPERLIAKAQKAFNFEGGRSGVEKVLSSSGIDPTKPQGLAFLDTLTEKLGPLREAILGSAQAAENYKSSLVDTIKSLNEQIKNNLPNLFSSITKGFGGDKIDPSKFVGDLQKALQEKDSVKQAAAFKNLESGSQDIQSQFGQDFFNNLIISATKSAGKALPASDFAKRELSGAQKERDVAAKNVNDTLFAKGSTDPASIKAVEDLRLAESKLAEVRASYRNDIKENGVSNLLSNISGRAATSQFDTKSLVENSKPYLSGRGRAQATQAQKALDKNPESEQAINDLIKALKEGAIGERGREKIIPQIAALEARKSTSFKDKSGGDLSGEKNLAQKELEFVNKEIAEMAKQYKDSGLPEAAFALAKSMREATETTNAYNKFAEELKNLSNTAIAKMGEADKTIKNISFRLGEVERLSPK